MRHSDEIFVFVVCGADEHIDALHFSIKALQTHSSKKIIVVTDSHRNEKPITFPNVIDFKTPEIYNNHQASIFLKTNLHRILPQGSLYCYLDTDVVAVNKKVDAIFNHYISPVTFASDTCLLDQFSPFAVACNCSKQYAEWRDQVGKLLTTHKDVKREPEIVEKKERLLKILQEKKKSKWRYFLLSLKFNLSKNTFKLDDDTFLDKKREYWHDKNGTPILYEKHIKTSFEIIESTTNYKYHNENGRTWWTINGVNIFDCRCNHLKEAVKRDFNIEIKKEDWQHWNGGVFLFDDSAFSFLETWHKLTITSFENSYWRTRDQGTLAATVWKFHLQEHYTLPIEFNFILNYNNPEIIYDGKFSFTFINYSKNVHPNFIHILNHWGDINWNLWNDISKRLYNDDRR